LRWRKLRTQGPCGPRLCGIGARCGVGSTSRWRAFRDASLVGPLPGELDPIQSEFFVLIWLDMVGRIQRRTSGVSDRIEGLDLYGERQALCARMHKGLCDSLVQMYGMALIEVQQERIDMEAAEMDKKSRRAHAELPRASCRRFLGRAVLLSLVSLLVSLGPRIAPASAAAANTFKLNTSGYQTGLAYVYADFYGPSGYYRRIELPRTFQLFDKRSGSFTGIPPGQFRVRVSWCSGSQCSGGSKFSENNYYGTFTRLGWYYQSKTCHYGGGCS
jgi:hypothetical protein